MTTTMPLTEAPQVGADFDFFEQIYVEAGGDRALVPWADEEAHPALVSWLNAVAPGLVRCGCRVAVVGCGLGEDARELMRRGYEVTAFDNSATAVAWARSLDTRNSECYHQEDLFALPGRWRHRFDLVVEINTIQALDPARRTETLAAMRELLSPHGFLLVICRGAEESVVGDAELDTRLRGYNGVGEGKLPSATGGPQRTQRGEGEVVGIASLDPPYGAIVGERGELKADGPPWALTEEELGGHAAEAGLVMEGELSSFWDEEEPAVLRMRGLFRR